MNGRVTGGFGRWAGCASGITYLEALTVVTLRRAGRGAKAGAQRRPGGTWRPQHAINRPLPHLPRVQAVRDDAEWIGVERADRRFLHALAAADFELG